MSLTIMTDLVQGSDEWLQARCGMVTASVVGKLISRGAPGAVAYDCPDCGADAGDPCVSKARKVPTPLKTSHSARVDVATERAPYATPVLTVATGDTARAVTLGIVAERITGWVEPSYMTPDMWRGVEDEPHARDAYADHYRPVYEVGFMVRDDWGFPIGYSPDGLVDDDGLIECKSRLQRKQVATILADAVPPECMAQIQCGLLVSGREWVDYISYSGGMHLWVKRVTPDPAWFAAIIAAVQQFEASAAYMVNRYLSAVQGLPLTDRRPSDDEIRI